MENRLILTLLSTWSILLYAIGCRLDHSLAIAFDRLAAYRLNLLGLNFERISGKHPANFR